MLVAAGGALLLALVMLWPSSPDGDPQTFKIYVTESGVYRVTYEELQEVGLAGPIRSRRVALTLRGQEVPVWVAGGGDGRFGPGDRIEFVGEQLRGHRSFYDEYTLLNAYRLTLGGPKGRRMTSPALPEAVARPAPPAQVEVESHMEENNFLVHFVGRMKEAPEPRFWARLSHIDPEPFQHSLWLGRGRDDARPVALTAELRGWSDAGRSRGGTLPDHRVDLYYNGQLVGSGEWNGHDSHRIEVSEVPKELFKPDDLNVVELRVPRRKEPGAEDPLVDVVLLNWIWIRYPQPEANSPLGGSWIPAEPQSLVAYRPPAAAGSPAKVRLAASAGKRLVVYGAGGSRFDPSNMEIEAGEHANFHHIYLPAEESRFYALHDSELRPPAAIELERPSRLKDSTRQADYIIIAHPRLLAAIEPLAAFHRRQGLEVAVVAVDDVYDEFNHSVLDPNAIREFLSYAYHQWQPPAPRFVLLVGDASWDAEGSRARYHGGRPYASDVPLSHRNLIPTWSFESHQGRAASDNFYACIDGDDHLPDLAIGRLPVAEPEELEAIVDKILRYSERVGVGPWRRRLLWLSDVTPFMQKRSDYVAASVAGQGFASLKLYPSEETENTQVPLVEAFDRGQLLVHFLGHGARYVWRTGADRDQRNNYDLFTLQHLEELRPTDKLAMVLSMTCWSAPFDHPSADSIGENFLRLPDRGAIAFLGASWKVAANHKFSELLVTELTAPGSTVGEAIMRAKRGFKARNLIENYNLLGDPAVKLALPLHRLDVTARAGGGEGPGIVATLPVAEFSGQAIVDWLDSAGEVVHSERLEIDRPTFEARFRPAGDGGEIARVRVYAWDGEAGIDGIGALELQPGAG